MSISISISLSLSLSISLSLFSLCLSLSLPFAISQSLSLSLSISLYCSLSLSLYLSLLSPSLSLSLPFAMSLSLSLSPCLCLTLYMSMYVSDASYIRPLSPPSMSDTHLHLLACLSLVCLLFFCNYLCSCSNVSFRIMFLVTCRSCSNSRSHRRSKSIHHPKSSGPLPTSLRRTPPKTIGLASSLKGSETSGESYFFCFIIFFGSWRRILLTHVSLTSCLWISVSLTLCLSLSLSIRGWFFVPLSPHLCLSLSLSLSLFLSQCFSHSYWSLPPWHSPSLSLSLHCLFFFFCLPVLELSQEAMCLWVSQNLSLSPLIFGWRWTIMIHLLTSTSLTLSLSESVPPLSDFVFFCWSSRFGVEWGGYVSVIVSEPVPLSFNFCWRWTIMIHLSRCDCLWIPVSQSLCLAIPLSLTLFAVYLPVSLPHSIHHTLSLLLFFFFFFFFRFFVFFGSVFSVPNVVLLPFLLAKSIYIFHLILVLPFGLLGNRPLPAQKLLLLLLLKVHVLVAMDPLLVRRRLQVMRIVIIIFIIITPPAFLGLRCDNVLESIIDLLLYLFLPAPQWLTCFFVVICLCSVVGLLWKCFFCRFFFVFFYYFFVFCVFCYIFYFLLKKYLSLGFLFTG